MRVMSVLGARPQFIKASVVSAAMKEHGIGEVMVHTGQHYDYEMSKLFFEQLGLPPPNYNLGIGSGSHGAQTGRILEEVEKVMLSEKPDIVMVYGDTNSTIGGALAAAKLQFPVAHVEAGLRSFNRQMPEEINRIVTDHLSDILFTPTRLAILNLRNEGIDDSKIIDSGDVMLDSIKKLEPLYLHERERLFSELGIRERHYFVATVHRAENTDDAKRLGEIVAALCEINCKLEPVVWPVHPRTMSRLQHLGITSVSDLRFIEPIGYLQMQALIDGARGVLTDSGGLQKEAAFHGVPTVTLREETEWPETIDAGCNVLAGAVREQIITAAAKTGGRFPSPAGFGDGNAAGIIADSIEKMDQV